MHVIVTVTEMQPCDPLPIYYCTMYPTHHYYSMVVRRVTRVRMCTRIQYNRERDCLVPPLLIHRLHWAELLCSKTLVTVYCQYSSDKMLHLLPCLLLERVDVVDDVEQDRRNILQECLLGPLDRSSRSPR
jgi:hypothetical protein